MFVGMVLEWVVGRGQEWGCLRYFISGMDLGVKKVILWIIMRGRRAAEIC